MNVIGFLAFHFVEPVFAVSIAPGRYEQMAAAQKNRDISVPVPRTQPAH